MLIFSVILCLVLHLAITYLGIVPVLYACQALGVAAFVGALCYAVARSF